MLTVSRKNIVNTPKFISRSNPTTDGSVISRVYNEILSASRDDISCTGLSFMSLIRDDATLMNESVYPVNNDSNRLI